MREYTVCAVQNTMYYGTILSAKKERKGWGQVVNPRDAVGAHACPSGKRCTWVFNVSGV